MNSVRCVRCERLVSDDEARAHAATCAPTPTAVVAVRPGRGVYRTR